jgi:hypothetical protein
LKSWRGKSLVGMDALDEARDEPDARLKLRHRHTAEGLLRGAYGDYRRAIREYESSPRTRMGLRPVTELVDNHEKATTVAVFIAAILQDAGARPAAVKWVGRAREHFAQYSALSRGRARRGVALNRVGQVTGTGAALLAIGASGGIGGILVAGGGGLAALTPVRDRLAA